LREIEVLKVVGVIWRDRVWMEHEVRDARRERADDLAGGGAPVLLVVLP
jgi:hypothetical protein